MPQCNVPPGAGAKLLHALHLHIGHKHTRFWCLCVHKSEQMCNVYTQCVLHMSCATSFIGNTLSCTLSYVLLHARLTIFQHLTRCYFASLTVVALSNTSLSYKLHTSHMPSMNRETDFVNKKKNNASTPWTHSIQLFTCLPCAICSLDLYKIIVSEPHHPLYQ